MKRTTLNSEDSFMRKFKYFKSKKTKPTLDKVISLENYNFAEEVENITFTVEDDSRTRALGLRDIYNWKAVSLSRHPGFIIIKNPFTSLGQRYWIRKCLEEYSKTPNKRNIDVDTNIDDWWHECFKKAEVDRKLQKKLRWATLGYHHDWDTKMYTEDNKGVFPAELAELCDVIALSIGYKKFKAEAAIVNYYHMGSTLSAHTDHSEVNLEAPLFSLSFGQNAIFLLGGHEKSIEPSAILLTSGDIAIMSKEARLCYHAVPKIIPCSIQPWNNPTLVEKMDKNFKYIKEDDIIAAMNRNLNDWTKFEAYIEESRINVNVRQVLNENQICL